MIPAPQTARQGARNDTGTVKRKGLRDFVFDAEYGLTRAPDLDRPGLTWFNVESPLGLADLRGRLVILRFLDFCCINCLHVVPTLRRLEERFPGEVVVIGVHSPKFSAEQDPENLRHAIARCGVSATRSSTIRAWSCGKLTA